MTPTSSYQDIRAQHGIVRPSGYDEHDARAPAHGYAQRLLQQDPAFQAQFAAFSTFAILDYSRLSFDSDSGGSTSNGRTFSSASRSEPRGVGEGEADSDDSSEVYVWFLPVAYPRLPSQFPRVPMPSSPRVVVLDVFGVILVRVLPMLPTLSPFEATHARNRIEKAPSATPSNRGSQQLAIVPETRRPS